MHKRASLLLLSLLSLPALADASLPNVSVGLEGYAETYRETVNGYTFMKETSQMFALIAAARVDLSQDKALEFSGRYGGGQADYSSGSGNKNGLTRTSADLRMVYKQDFTAGTNTITPEIGLGMRMLSDHLDEFKPGG